MKVVEITHEGTDGVVLVAGLTAGMETVQYVDERLAEQDEHWREVDAVLQTAVKG